jgi:hypothetical protein
MKESWAQYKRLPLNSEISEEEKLRRLNGTWPSYEEEAKWSDGSRSQSSPVIPSATTDE